MKHASPTDSQRLAIDERGRTLLVAAAAGSGKTFTLTERIIHILLSEEAELDELLIVTFTTAAASELRERIGAALLKALTDDPTSTRLQRQYLSLADANILTIDAFCNDLLRRNADRVGLPPNYRVPDMAEVHLLCASVMETLIDGLYDGAYPEIGVEAFATLADCFSNARGDASLSEELLSLYTKLQSQEAGVDALRPLIAMFDVAEDTPVDRLPFVPYLVRRAAEPAAAYLGRFERYRAELGAATDRAGTAYATNLDTIITLLRTLARADGYAACYTALSSFTFPRAPSVRDKDELLLAIDRTYASLRDELRSVQRTFFSYDPALLYPLCRQLHAVLTTLVDILSIFDHQYRAEKRRLGICEYADMERYAYECLWQYGERTPFAEAMRARFKGVYIDEYQDVNRLQDRIFEAVSTERGRFMVGDIKQSIYGFRSADPDVFADMKRTYPPLTRAEDSPCASLYMSENFRCDAAVVNAVNEVFDTIFGAVGERIGYVHDDRLIFAKRTPAGAPRRPCEYLAVETVLDAEEEIDEEADLNRATAEAHAVARRMREMLDTERTADGTPLVPSDIAVLFRSKRHVPLFTDILASYGIKSATVESCDLFLNPDVLLALCLLNAIDNPSKDIYLTGLLVSPIFGFTPDELVAIRRACPESSLYRALQVYAEATQDAKCLHCLRSLSQYRTIAEGMPMDTLLFRLYRETGLLSLATQHGGREHLLLLYEYARSFERSSYRGLYAFISYINRLIENKTAFAASSEDAATEDAVRLLTVHASKGLEFPVVFLVGCGTHIRRADKGICMLYARDFGVSLRLPDDSAITSVDNPFRAAIADRLYADEFDEELRILYVAMTRARERLIMAGTVGKSYDDFLQTVKERFGDGGAFGVRRMRSFAELIVATAREHIHIRVVRPSLTPVSTDAQKDVADSGNDIDTTLADTLTQRFAYVYPDAHLTTLPEKLSVSYLYPTVLDGTEEDEPSLTLDTPPVSHKDKSTLPPFFTGKEKDQSAERGIATHMVMQFCDFERLHTLGVRAELDRLVEARFLSPTSAALVREDELQAFANSALLCRLLDAKAVHRELRFHVHLPAADFTADEEKKRALADARLLVQGVMDCVMEDGDGEIHLIDYKTDRLSPAARADRAVAEEELRAKHRLQLTYYAAAVEAIFGRKPRSVQIYSLALGDTIDV